MPGMKSFAIASILLLTTAPSFADPEVPDVESSELTRSPDTLRPPNWNGGEPIAPGYHLTTRVDTGYVVAGAVTFGALYLSTAALAGALDNSWFYNGCCGSLFIPVVGPFVQMGECTGGGCKANVLFAIDGITQAAGLAMLVYGLAAQKTVLVRNDVGLMAKATRKLVLTPVPILSPTTQGMGIIGTF
jgi:hypothetical protein